MTNVVSLTGDKLPDPDKPNPEVVKLLEKWLKRARAGEVTGITISAIYRDGDAGSSWAGTLSIQMLGHIHMLAHTLASMLAADDTEIR